jgi:glycyl-tRNA synthetase beta chain
MSDRRDLLIEIGTEELPPKALSRLSDAFADAVYKGLEDAGLSPAACRAYAAPRRLAVICGAVAPGQQDREVTRKGPAVAAAFDADGNPTKAVQGFARSCGVEVDALQQVDTDKGAYLVFQQQQAGQPASCLIPGIVEKALAALPIPKRMRWGAGDIEFLRPVHWIVLLFGHDVIDATILGLAAGRHTHGHRFHHPEAISLDSTADYVDRLEDPGRVIVDRQRRQDSVRAQAEAAGVAVGGEALISASLLDEVTNLVEWPVAITGEFDPEFLSIPREALISSMQGHQKYFPVQRADGSLLPRFITIANIESRDAAQIKAGNERVIRPRLSDAVFFWEQDQRQPLAASVDKLKTVVFQNKLGSLYQKSQRVSVLAQSIAAEIGGDVRWAERAAEIGKCDLLSAMVGEFPDLQGIMGRYYAEANGEPAEVAAALDEQYLPRFAGGQLPTTPTGQALAIAERLDTLAGIFAIGQPPTGDKDPFALRRAAIGTLRTMVEQKLDLDLSVLLGAAAAGLGDTDVEVDESLPDRLFEFMMDRLKAYYVDRDIAIDSYDAVLACRPTRPLDFDLRVRAVTAFRELPECAALAAANKRIRNILKQVDSALPTGVDTSLMEADSERELATQTESLRDVVAPLIAARNYTEALSRLAALREPVDAFFDEVMVMADDPAVKANRLALLRGLSELFLQIADLSRLQLAND